MSDTLVHVRNIKTGRIGDVPRSVFENSYLNPGVLEEVDADAKPYHPDMYVPKEPTAAKPVARTATTRDSSAESTTDSKDVN